jgi:hypothetical protein
MSVLAQATVSFSLFSVVPVIKKGTCSFKSTTTDLYFPSPCSNDDQGSDRILIHCITHVRMNPYFCIFIVFLERTCRSSA